MGGLVCCVGSLHTGRREGGSTGPDGGRESLKKGSRGDRRQEAKADAHSKPHKKNAQF